jgi:DNA-binding IclR family transcriptional regulator
MRSQHWIFRDEVVGVGVSKITARTLDFIELFATQRRALTLSEICRLLSIPVSSCYDVLQALEERGFIYEVAVRGGYYPTARLFDLGKTIMENDPVVLRADMLLRELRDRVDESVLLAKVKGLVATYLLGLEPSHAFRFRLSAGSTISSLHASSAGKALLGTLDEAGLAKALRTIVFRPLTPKTVTSAAALRRRVAEGQRRGWHANLEESLEGLTTLSAAFFWHRSAYIVTIAGPTARLGHAVEDAAKLLVDTCRRLETNASARSVDAA